MTTFEVDPEAVTELAAALQEACHDVAQAKLYTEAHGNFTFHEVGAMGMLIGRHSSLMDQLDELYERLSAITEKSSANLLKIAESYGRSDDATAKRIDASYPSVERPALSRD
jgi:hypothetical protein